MLYAAAENASTVITNGIPRATASARARRPARPGVGPGVDDETDETSVDQVIDVARHPVLDRGRPDAVA
jgi:hypothetical protein